MEPGEACQERPKRPRLDPPAQNSESSGAEGASHPRLDDVLTALSSSNQQVQAVKTALLRLGSSDRQTFFQKLSTPNGTGPFKPQSATQSQQEAGSHQQVVQRSHAHKSREVSASQQLSQEQLQLLQILGPYASDPQALNLIPQLYSIWKAITAAVEPQVLVNLANLLLTAAHASTTAQTAAAAAAAPEKDHQPGTSSFPHHYPQDLNPQEGSFSAPSRLNPSTSRPRSSTPDPHQQHHHHHQQQQTDSNRAAAEAVAAAAATLIQVAQGGSTSPENSSGPPPAPAAPAAAAAGGGGGSTHSGRPSRRSTPSRYHKGTSSTGTRSQAAAAAAAGGGAPAHALLDPAIATTLAESTAVAAAAAAANAALAATATGTGNAAGAIAPGYADERDVTADDDAHGVNGGSATHKGGSEGAPGAAALGGGGGEGGLPPVGPAGSAAAAVAAAAAAAAGGMGSSLQHSHLHIYHRQQQYQQQLRHRQGELYHPTALHR